MPWTEYTVVLLKSSIGASMPPSVAHDVNSLLFEGLMDAIVSRTVMIMSGRFILRTELRRSRNLYIYILYTFFHFPCSHEAFFFKFAFLALAGCIHLLHLWCLHVLAMSGSTAAGFPCAHFFLFLCHGSDVHSGRSVWVLFWFHTVHLAVFSTSFVH